MSELADDNRPEPPAGGFTRPKDLDRTSRTTLGARIGWGVEALAWDWIYWKPMRTLPVETASNTVAGVLRTLGPLSSQHRTMIRNLRMAFPDWSDRQIQDVARGAWDMLGRIAGEMPHLADIQPYVDNARIEVVGAERLDELRLGNKAAVIISCHMANWEVISAAICRRPLDCQITYRAANNPHIDRKIAKARMAGGVRKLAPKGVATRELMRALTRGESIALMNDQKFNQGIPVPFFGRDAMTAPGPTRLAMKFNAPLLPVTCVRTGVARYRVTVHAPFLPETGPDEEAAIKATVLKINHFIEARIREHPEQWFWMHNRWPKEEWVKAGVM